MAIFQRFNKVYDNIRNEDDFNDSKFQGAEEMLNVEFSKCLVASNVDSDDLSELYYFIEDNSEIIRRDGDMTLHRFDHCDCVLYNDYDEIAIIVTKKNSETVENFI